jgi:hypothetical protein
MTSGLKQCPFCAEDIKVEAIKCKHCGSDLGTTKFDKVMPYGKSAQEVASGIKKAEWDKGMLQGSIFWGLAVAVFIGWLIGSNPGYEGLGWFVGILITMVWSWKATTNYYKK